MRSYLVVMSLVVFVGCALVLWHAMWLGAAIEAFAGDIASGVVSPEDAPRRIVLYRGSRDGWIAAAASVGALVSIGGVVVAIVQGKRPAGGCLSGGAAGSR
jgi:hypothetical protein